MKKNQQTEYKSNAQEVRKPTDLSFQLYKKEGGPGGARPNGEYSRRDYFNTPSSQLKNQYISKEGQSSNQR